MVTMTSTMTPTAIIVVIIRATILDCALRLRVTFSAHVGIGSSDSRGASASVLYIIAIIFCHLS